MTMLTEGMTSSGEVEWETPDTLYRPLNEIWDFTLDGAASHRNAKCDRYCTAEGTFARVPKVCTCVVQQRNLQTNELIHDDGQDGRGLCYLRDPNVQAFGAVRIFAEDGLNFPWKDERVFLNPPWGEGEEVCDVERCRKQLCADRGRHCSIRVPGIDEFLRHAYLENMRYGVKVVAVLPARMDTAWMHDWVLGKAILQYRRGRVKFIDPQAEERKAQGLKPRNAPPVGIVIATYK